jgi:EmrB/QacA subfamily drug resistance transporter
MKTKSPWGLLSLLLIGTFMGTLGNSMVSIALSALKDHFSVPLTSAVWSITLYTLTFSVLMPIFSVLGPAIGIRRLYLGGMGFVCAGSLLSVLAPNFGIFIVARIITGIGVGTFLPSIMWVITNKFHTDFQGRATGYWALVNSLGHAIGPTLSGFLLQYLDWRSIFYINIPLGLVCIFLSIKVFPIDKRASLKRFDTAGAIATAVLTFSMMLAITFAIKKGLESFQTIVLLATTAISLLFMIFYEHRQSMPFVDLSLFKNRKYLASISAISTQAFSQFGLLVSLPLFLIEGNAMNQQTAGLLVMIMTMMMALISPISGKLSDDWGSKKVCWLGILFLAIGAASFLIFHVETITGMNIMLFAAGLLIFGTGFGFIQSASTVSVIHSVPAEKAGAATGFFHMIRFVNASLGSTVFGIILENNKNGLIGGYYLGFTIILVLSVCVLPVMFWMAEKSRNPAPSI